MNEILNSIDWTATGVVFVKLILGVVALVCGVGAFFAGLVVLVPEGAPLDPKRAREVCLVLLLVWAAATAILFAGLA